MALSFIFSRGNMKNRTISRHTQVLVYVYFMLFALYGNAGGIFTRLGWLEHINTTQKNYGIAVSDVDNDSDLEFIVAGFTGSNFVLKYDRIYMRLENIALPFTPYEALRDPGGRAIGVCACDVDGDGREEIYFLNTNNAYAGKSTYGDKLFKWRYGQYEDLYEDEVNRELDAKEYAGRSVACIDRLGTGKYSFIIGTYSDGDFGNFALIEMDEKDPRNSPENGVIVLKNNAKEAGIDKATGGRGIVVGPILGNLGNLDIFFANEGSYFLGNPGANLLFRNNGNGTYFDVAQSYGIADEEQNGRGVALADLNHDCLLDIVCGNWEGSHRIFLQKRLENGHIKFENVATKDFEQASLIHTVIIADFNNDGNTEIFMNNIYDNTGIQPNRLFTVILRKDKNVLDILPYFIGDALEPFMCGTGGAIADINGDGVLDLLISHGEVLAQKLTIYTAKVNMNNNWIRVFPKSQFGAPARGASVYITLDSGEERLQIIDSGSGYMCEMEPVAHFGLGRASAVNLKVIWPDGRLKSQVLTKKDAKKTIIVKHPLWMESPINSELSQDKESYTVTSRYKRISTVKGHEHGEL
ncbi:hypothetical protein CHS0354_021004 [Potamilus streckersoni]|uniref:ASPIC/UnbV domain-containing protein n=1 Tax=Potamilus streckersoni TaxID=2493646 RepID=A0AAE0RUK7_9BIVA|nr:hypothetical protein CHS0354_021004 [Potamilus streckersoni]